VAFHFSLNPTGILPLASRKQIIFLTTDKNFDSLSAKGSELKNPIRKEGAHDDDQ